MKKVLLSILLVLLLVLVCCKEEELIVTGPDTIKVGESVKLNANYDEVTWSISDDSIASCELGVVKGLKKGEVTIEARYKDYTYNHKITVVNIEYDIKITGVSEMRVGDEYDFSCTVTPFEKASFTSSDLSILDIDENGYSKALKAGKVTVKATVLDSLSTFEVEVKEKRYTLFEIEYKNSLEVGETSELNIKIESFYDYTFDYVLSNDCIELNDNIIKAIKEGECIIKIYAKEDELVYKEIKIVVTEKKIPTIEFKSKNSLCVGEIDFEEVIFSKDFLTKEIVYEFSCDNAILDNGFLLALTEGKVNIKAYVKDFPEIFCEKEIEIVKGDKHIDEELDKKAQEILDNMSLKQKIGQMFVIGFTQSMFTEELFNAINEYNFGNIIYMGYNCNNPLIIREMSNAIQNEMITKNGVPAFIATDQEGGRVARLTTGATHFISNMALGATQNPNNSFEVGKRMGGELMSYGINTDFAPVLDVNNNSDNPVIGVRSYFDNPVSVSLFGSNMIKGLKQSGVMATSKHFPGHGNTSTDSHYGLPKVDSSYSELLKMELAPFINAVYTGIDAMMTTHIIFSEIDSVYPATLSSIILKDILRDKIGYDGLIISDSMEMNAISKFFGSYNETSVKAVNAGVDILTYTGLSNAILAYEGLLKAVNENHISITQIDESVKRIIKKKISLGIIDNYYSSEDVSSETLLENEKFNVKLAMESLTVLKGEFNGLDKNKRTLIISPTCTYDLQTSGTNSLGTFAIEYLKEFGYDKITSMDVDKVNNSVINDISVKAKRNEIIVVAFSNVKTKNLTTTINLVNILLSLNKEVIVIGLNSPYDYMCYNNLKTYINVYGYQKASVIAITKYLNGEFKASGISPIK